MQWGKLFSLFYTKPQADQAVTAAVSAGVSAASVEPSKICFVAKNGDDVAGTGTLSNPYATLQKALDSIDNSGWQIIVAPGTYAESPTCAKQNCTLTALGIESGGLVNITGTFTFSHVASSVRVAGLSCASIAHTGAGNLYLKACRATTALSSSGTGYLEVADCDLQGVGTGVVSITGGGSKYFGAGNKVGLLTVNNAGAIVTLDGQINAAPISLVNGTLALAKGAVYSAAGTLPAVTATGGVLMIDGATMLTPTGTQARISIAAGVVYELRRCWYDKANSTLSGIPLASSGSDSWAQEKAWDYIVATEADLALKYPAGANAGKRALIRDAHPYRQAYCSGTDWIVKESQDKLVSGTNLKTLNGQSLLGAGDLPIAGGGASGSSVTLPVIEPVLAGDVVDIVTDAGVAKIKKIIQSIAGASDTIATAGAPITVDATLPSFDAMSYVCTRLDVDKVITAVRTSATNIRFCILTINGTVITPGNIYNVTTNTNESNILDRDFAVPSPNLACLLRGHSSYTSPYPIITSLRISGDQILGHSNSAQISDTTIMNTGTAVCYGASIKALSTSSLLILFCVSASTNFAIMPIGADGVLGTRIALNSVAINNSVSPTVRIVGFELTPSGKFVFNNNGSGSWYFGQVTGGNTITFSGSLALSTGLGLGTYGAYATRVLDANRVLIARVQNNEATGGLATLGIMNLASLPGTFVGEQRLLFEKSSAVCRHVSIHLTSATSGVALLGAYNAGGKGLIAKPFTIDLATNTISALTFLANATSGSPTLTGVSGIDWSKVAIGQAVVGGYNGATDALPANGTISSFSQASSTITLSANCTLTVAVRCVHGNSVDASGSASDVNWPSRAAALAGSFVVFNYNASTTKFNAIVEQMGASTQIAYTAAKGIVQADQATVGGSATAALLTTGISKAHAGLTPGAAYYLQADGKIGTSNPVYAIGYATDSTTLLLNPPAMLPGLQTIYPQQSDRIAGANGVATFTSPVNGMQAGVLLMMTSNGATYVPAFAFDVVNKYITYYGRSSAPAVSNSGECVMYFDTTLGKLRVSENGGAFANVV